MPVVASSNWNRNAPPEMDVSNGYGGPDGTPVGGYSRSVRIVAGTGPSGTFLS